MKASRKKRVLITAGGTGGHLFPAQALAQELRQSNPEVEVLFVAYGLSGSRYLDHSKWSSVDIDSSTISSKNPWQILKAGLKLCKGFFGAWKQLRTFKPDVVVGFGSYHTLPVIAAAKVLRYPFVLHEANSVLGKVNEYFASSARVTCINVPLKVPVKGKSVTTGMPIREGLTRAFSSPQKARKALDLDENTFTLLLTGGSQGAAVLNTRFAQAISLLAEKTQGFQVIQLTGEHINIEQLEDFYEELGIRAYIRAFEDNMAPIWIATDLVIGRAGASALAEQVAMEVPGIVVPYPEAADNHQEYNARYFAETVGGGVCILQEELSPETLERAICDFLQEDRKQLVACRKNISRHKTSGPQRTLCSIVSEVAGIKIR